MNPNTLATDTTNTTIDQGSFIDQFIHNQTLALVVEIIVAIGIITILIMISKAVSSMIKRRILGHASPDQAGHIDQIATLVSDIVFYCLVIFSIFVGFEILGFDVGLILGGVSFGVGLAFKEVLGNMIAGVMILTTQQVKLGDVIRIHADEEYFGTIEEISVRYTMLRTFENKQVVIPNITLITVPIQTFSAEAMVRLDTVVEVHYRTDLSQAQSVVLQALRACPRNINPDASMALVEAFGESGITIKAYRYIDPKAGLLVDQAIAYTNQTIKSYLDANQIEIPYPHIVIASDAPHRDPLT